MSGDAGDFCDGYGYGDRQDGDYSRVGCGAEKAGDQCRGYEADSAGGRADAELLRRAVRSNESLDTINPVYLRDPLSPNIAAAREDRVLDLAPVFDAFDRLSKVHDCVLVEGVGRSSGADCR